MTTDARARAARARPEWEKYGFPHLPRAAQTQQRFSCNLPPTDLSLSRANYPALQNLGDMCAGTLSQMHFPVDCLKDDETKVRIL
jgi:hypothetical protein